MKLIIGLSMLVGAYFYVLSHTTDIVLGQTRHLQAVYQNVSAYSDQLASGK